MQDPGAEDQARLAGRIAAGDRDAETELVEIFAPRVFAILCARTRDREAARDLLQDTFIAVLRGLRKGQLRDSEKLAGFIQGVIKHIVQEHKRGERGREEPLAVDPPAVIAIDPVENSQRDGLVRRALEQLDSTDQEILLRTLAHGQKPGVIAKALRLSPDVVRQRKSRATKKVAEFIRMAVTKTSAAPTTKGAE